MAEFEVINQYFLGALMPSHVSVGPGDDCAVIEVPEGHELCVSTDTLLEGVHFPLGAEPELIAQRSIAANLSDLAAMSAVPHSMTMALTLPGISHDWLRRFAERSQQYALDIGCPIVGGNLAEGSLSITITVMGVVPKGQAIKRSGAKVGDSVFVSGSLGGAAGAVSQLGCSEPNPGLFAYYANPTPRLSLMKSIRNQINSAIDISDGLLADLGHLLAASRVGASLEIEKVPQAPELAECFSVEEAQRFVLCGGDDYEICFTVSAEHETQLYELSQQLGVAVSKIGQVTNEAGVIRSAMGEALSADGYKHFSSKS